MDVRQKKKLDGDVDGGRDKLGNQELNFDSNDPGKGLGESTMTICVEQVQCTILHRAPAENLIRIQEEE